MIDELHDDHDDEIRVHPLGDVDEPLEGIAGLDDQILDAADSEAEKPLTEDESRELLAGLLEMPFAGAGWMLGRSHPDLLRDAIEDAWALPPTSARRLAGTAWLAMPRTWRESRILERVPALLFVGQMTAIMRLRLVATRHLIDTYQENPDALRPLAAGDAVSPGRRPPARGADDERPGVAGDARADGDHDATAPEGLGIGAPISRRAAERLERRRAAATARDAVRPA